jgi:hypothetical protein
MKIRIKGNSVRLRLTQSEVDNFSKNGMLEEHTAFGSNELIYALERKAAADELLASFEGNRITLFVPEKLSTIWTTTDRVGMENLMEIGDGKRLFLLVEKDWACIDRTDEDQSDNYPNPNQGC